MQTLQCHTNTYELTFRARRVRIILYDLIPDQSNLFEAELVANDPSIIHKRSRSRNYSFLSTFLDGQSPKKTTRAVH